MALTVGLEIGGSAVRAAAVDSGKDGRILRRFAEMPLPVGAVISGEIIDEGAVGEAVAA
ncbi:MAG: pilus assembly protein PilM, partial [Actinobacteria bacterium]